MARKIFLRIEGDNALAKYIAESATVHLFGTTWSVDQDKSNETLFMLTEWEVVSDSVWWTKQTVLLQMLPGKSDVNMIFQDRFYQCRVTASAGNADLPSDGKRKAV